MSRIAALERLAVIMAESLGIDCPIVSGAGDALESPARASAADFPQGEVEFDGRFLERFGRDRAACWIVMAHEMGHLYWDQRDDLAGALPGFEWEDSADFTAGQLTAAHGRHPIAARAALRRVLAEYDGLDPSGFHRGIDDRQRIFLHGYAVWAEERRFW